MATSCTNLLGITYIASKPGSERFEKLPVRINHTIQLLVKRVANRTAEVIRSCQAAGQPCCIGLCAGESVKPIYAELVAMHKAGELSFANVHAFVIDDYFPVLPNDTNSHRAIVCSRLLDLVDIPKDQIHSLDAATREEGEAKCAEFEALIGEKGTMRMDLQLLGVGVEGEFSFNEAGTLPSSVTRFTYIGDYSVRRLRRTRILNAVSAHTMGIGTILRAKEIILIAWGQERAEAVRRLVEGVIDPLFPASLLQHSAGASIFLDELAASRLARCQTPWLCEDIDWDANRRLKRVAVVWLAQKTKQAILRLTAADFAAHGLGALARGVGQERACLDVFYDLQHTITAWPGGKPGVDDSTRPERALPVRKRVIAFSPHPDDDVISMGGTLRRLCEQGHDVHVAYEVSGNVAVLDDYARRMLALVSAVAREAGASEEVLANLDGIAGDIGKNPRTKSVMRLNELVRQSEAAAAARHCGVQAENVHFLHLPFYETGTDAKSALGPADTEIVIELLRKVQPHQIYCAGDLLDPHGTHAQGLLAILRALDVLCDEPWFKDCRVWWYRGAWDEWPLSQVDMAVPLSPADVLKKRHAVYRHGSQLNEVAYPGDDPREFWQRSEDRNRSTAEAYNAMGLAEYQALECFARYQHQKWDGEGIRQL